MGNELSSYVPSQILHVEQCLQEISTYSFVEELGCSRFFKVAKVKRKDQDRYAVVKVFMIPDPSLSINEYKNALKIYCQKIDGASNILPYTHTFVTDRAAFLVRDYIDHSLYDRISTRPFLTIDEKKWIAFQLLCALSQCHTERGPLQEHGKADHDKSDCKEPSRMMCHGDIKSENILLTSWGWLYLADMAPFKPVYLPADNPGEFAFFFDASRRRAGYVAPERFVDTQKAPPLLSASFSTNSSSSTGMSSSDAPLSDPHGEVKVMDTDWNQPGFSSPFPSDQSSLGADISTGMGKLSSRRLLPSMDIFSAGCVLLELFTDGTTPFNLSQLLNYRAGEKSRLELLNRVKDADIREMISSMICLSSDGRTSAEYCLLSQRGKAFPEFYYRHLKTYMKQFLQPSMSNPDIRVCKLKKDLESRIDIQAGDKKRPCAENGSLVILVNVLTAAVRHLQTEFAKLEGLGAMLELGKYLTADIVIDRIVPHMLEFIDPCHTSEVRRYAVECVAHCVSKVEDITSADLNFFPDYLLPAIAPLANDPDVEVRITFGENIARLAETALRFLDKAQSLRMQVGDGDEKPPLASYDTELQVLRLQMRDKVVTLLSDPDNRVRESLVNVKSLTSLSNFFGKSRANDILLSHIITFVNDKEDFLVRCSFYEAVASLALILGSQSTPVLRSLLEQGLLDPEERVVECCLQSLASLARRGLLSNHLMIGLIHLVVPMLAHPSTRLRTGALLYLTAFAHQATEASAFVQLIEGETVRPYFKRSLHSFKKFDVLEAALEEPLPVAVFECAARSSRLAALASLLKDRNSERSRTHSRNQQDPCLVETLPMTTQDGTSDVFRKLQSLGMTPALEDKLLALLPLLISLNRARANSSSPSSSSTISAPSSHPQDQLFAPHHLDVHGVQDRQMRSEHGGGAAITSDSEANKEWQHMFTSPSSQNIPSDTLGSPLSRRKTPQLASPLASTGPGSTGSSIRSDARPTLGHIKQSSMESNSANMIPSSNEWVSHYGNLLRDRLSTGYGRDMTDSFQWVANSTDATWRPKGILLSHLHEHKVGHISLLSDSNNQQLVSCGGDGFVKFWDCGMMSGVQDDTCNRYLPSRSNRTYTASINGQQQAKACKGLVWTDCDKSVATVSDASYLHIVDRTQGTGVSVTALPVEQYGKCLCLAAPRASAVLSSSSSAVDSPLLVYVTTGGFIMARDLRTPTTGSQQHAWKLEQNKESGMMSSLVVHSCQTWLVTGSSRGYLVCWDLRYQRPVSQAIHPYKASFYRLALHPGPALISGSNSGLDDRHNEMNTSAPQILASCDKNNEVSSWDLETCTRITTLWASHAPLLSSKEASRHSIRAFLVGGSTSPYVITGGTDYRLRYWDLACPEKSSMIAHRGTEEIFRSSASITYRNQVVEGTDVLIEEMTLPSNNEAAHNSPLVRDPTRGHVNTISDLAFVEAGQRFLVSASVDGVVKFWK